MKMIDHVKFFKEFENAVNKFEEEGFMREDIQICISNAVRVAVLKSIESQVFFKGFPDKSLIVDESPKFFGVLIPKDNYPFNDRIILFTRESCMGSSPIVNIIYKDIELH